MVLGNIEKNILKIYMVSALLLMVSIGSLGFGEVINDHSSATAVESIGKRGTAIYVDPNGMGDYTTIQQAVDNAIAGDTIYVWSGVYQENVLVEKKISIIGNSSMNTILDGNGTGDGFNITSDMVKIVGFSIQNCSLNLGGILLYNVSFCNISNNKFSNNTNGIYLKNSHRNLISNNIFIDNQENGIAVIESQFNELNSNSFSRNNAGIYLNGYWRHEPTYNIIAYNNCTNNRYGIHCIISYYNDLNNNTCSDNEIGILIESLSKFYSFTNWLMDNICNFNSNSGITLSGSSDNTVSRNNYNNNLRTGLSLQDADYNTIENNVCINTNQGIVLDKECSENIVKSNYCSQNTNGIVITDSTINTLCDNICSDNNIGIIILESIENTFNNNNITLNNNGILLDNSDRNTFIENQCSSNEGYGIKFKQYSEFNKLYLNNISLNADYGVILSPDSDNNRFYHNNFINNHYQLDENSQNNWDNGYGEGNYWSDYTGLDNGAGNRLARDGIGDTKIPHLGCDNYPFILPNGWFVPVAPFLNDPGKIDRNGEYSLTWIHNQAVDGFILEEDVDPNFNSPSMVYHSKNGSIHQYSINGKTEGTYYYRIKAHSGEFNSTWSNIIEITVDYDPPAPQNLQVFVWPEGNALNISWDIIKNETRSDIVKYQLQSRSSGDWIEIAYISHPKYIYDHTGLSNGISYSYRIRAWDSQGRRSEFSPSETGIPMDIIPPEPPTGLKVIKKTFDYITLKWNGTPSLDLKGYNIYRKIGTVVNTSSINWSKPLNNDILLYNTEYNDTGLEPGTTYFYVVTSVDFEENESPNSEILMERTYLISEYPQPPIVNKPQLDLSIPEDGYDQTSINLYQWFYDINGDDLTFKFNSSNSSHISVILYPENGKVVLIPHKNWNGKEQLTFFASDGIFEISDFVNVTIIPINDAPEAVFINKPENGLTAKDSTLLIFQGNATDPDLIYGDELSFKWYSDKDGVLGIGRSLSDVRLKPGRHRVTLMVTDSSNLNGTASINITIVHPKEPSEELTSLIVVSPIVIILIIVAIFIILRYLRHRRDESENSEKNDKTNTRLATGVKEEQEDSVDKLDNTNQ